MLNYRSIRRNTANSRRSRARRGSAPPLPTAIRAAASVLAVGWAVGARSARARGVTGLLAFAPAQTSLAPNAVAAPPPAVLTPKQRLRLRVSVIVYVTAVECGGLYKWLRHSLAGRASYGSLYLVLEETLESGLLVVIFARGPADQSQMISPAAAAHLQKAQRSAALVINAEIIIWLVWLSMNEKVPGWLSGLYLFVAMHLKHALEAATVRDVPYANQCRSGRVTIGSLTETIGAVVGLRLMQAGRYRRGGLALTAGIGFEHILFINAVQSEMEKRDIALPKSASRASGT